ncbi:MAG: VPLPA-CTERM sorting domain-containing protein [Proteobacteria bacterium]|nr:VPLPA-CTERM sorting domain-containing protein [Burkholderiales bacterium]
MRAPLLASIISITHPSHSLERHMKTFRPRTLLAAGCAAAALALPTIGYSASVSVVAPNALEFAPGNAQSPAPFNFYGSSGSRTQMVYSSSFFQTSGPLSINEILFRPFPGFAPSGFFGDTLNISNVTVQLSTTSRLDEAGTPLAATFASNVGANVQTVYSGALSITTAATAGPTAAFDYRIALQSAFAYDPSQGNLLLDVLIPDGAVVSGPGLLGFGTFDNVNTANDGVYSVNNIGSGSALSGTANTAGAIAKFLGETPGPGVAVIPVPAALPLMLSGLIGLGIFARRKQQA